MYQQSKRGYEMKFQPPERLNDNEKLTALVLRNRHLAHMAEEDDERLVRIGRAQGFEEALTISLGSKEAARTMQQDLAVRAGIEDDIAAFIDAGGSGSDELQVLFAMREVLDTRSIEQKMRDVVRRVKAALRA